MEQIRTGIVTKSTGSHYDVVDCIDHTLVSCKLKGKVRLQEIKTTNPVAVGDQVDYEWESFQQSTPGETPKITSGKTSKTLPALANTALANTNVMSEIGTRSDGAVLRPKTDANSPVKTGLIICIHPRSNYIIRKSSNLSKEAHIIASNIDQAFLILTLDFPKTNFEFIDRFLVTAEAYKIPVTLILNKTDRYTQEHQPLLEKFRSIYTAAGYPQIELSAQQDHNLEPLKALLRGKISLFSGNSGVGKSTLIHAIDPTIETRAGEISKYHNRGKHTTTFSEMYPLNGGGYLIDTPGIKGFGIIDIEDREIGCYFPELFKQTPNCQFYNCTHTHEPGCAVKTAVENGQISESRYLSYLKILDDDTKYRK